jgi:hypothetical protein
MLRRAEGGTWFGWLSYTLMRAERYTKAWEFGPTGEVLGSRMQWLPFAFDQTHVLHLVGGVNLPLGWKISAGFHLNSGRPESGAITSRAQQPAQDPVTGAPVWQLTPLWTEPRLPAYARVDLRVSKTWTLDDLSLELYLDITNVSGTQEVLGYTYQGAYDNQSLERMPIAFPIVLPFLGVRVRL